MSSSRNDLSVSMVAARNVHHELRSVLAVAAACLGQLTLLTCPSPRISRLKLTMTSRI